MTLILPSDATPGASLIYDRDAPPAYAHPAPLRCEVCGKGSFALTEGGCPGCRESVEPGGAMATKFDTCPGCDSLRLLPPTRAKLCEGCDPWPWRGRAS